jgi:hypothetical protein
VPVDSAINEERTTKDEIHHGPITEKQLTQAAWREKPCEKNVVADR